MNVNKIIESLNVIKQSLSDIATAIAEAQPKTTEIVVKPGSKMIEIPISKKTGKCVSRRSFNTEFNPANQTAGSVNGAKAAGVPKTKTDRRPYGSVGFKKMTVEQKRAYWRWANDRKNMRRQLKEVMTAMGETSM